MKIILAFFCFVLAVSGYSQNLNLDSANWRFRSLADTNWLKAGHNIDLYQALAANNIIRDPYLGLSDSLLTWVEEQDWVFETTFPIRDPKQFGELVLRGVDTYADIYVNKQLVLQTNNSFKEYRVDISAFAKKGLNQLQILFHSTVNRELQKAKSAGLIYPADSDNHPWKTSVFARKPSYHFGWDFAPRKVNCRIEKISIHPKSSFRIAGFTVRLFQSGIQTTAIANAEIYSTKKQQVTLSFELGEGLLTSKQMTLLPGLNTANFDLTIQKPTRWWPVGLGDQNLYKAIVKCSKKGEVEILEKDIGFREIKLIQTADNYGEKFQFVVNNLPFFAKGFNYIQTEKSITEDEVKAWAAAGINMIRVWGGGNYGSDKLYELCDQYGILIWQDFMFANSMYPGDSAFLNNVKEEAIYQVKRLRDHPSLALWCGNNEVEVAWNNWGWQKKYKYSVADSLKLASDYYDLFKTILPSLVDSLDVHRFYFSSSPISNWGKSEDFSKGDNHFWGVYHGEMPFEAYNTQIPRFASEYGMQSYPSIETLKEFIPESELYLNSPAINKLQRSYKGNALLDRYMGIYLDPAADLEDFVYKSQVLQAEAMKMAIEAHRRNMAKCAGSLLWQWNDAALGASWSLVDYLGRKKAAYYTSMKAYSPWLISPVINNDSIQIWLVNDFGTADKLSIRIILLNFYNDTLKSMVIKSESLFNESRLVYGQAVKNWLTTSDKKQVWLKVELYSNDGNRPLLLSSNELYFDTLKNLSFPDPEISYQLRDAGIKLSWKNHSKYLKFLYNGENYFTTSDRSSITLPYDGLSGPIEIRARSLGNPELLIKP